MITKTGLSGKAGACLRLHQEVFVPDKDRSYWLNSDSEIHYSWKLARKASGEPTPITKMKEFIL